MSISLIPESAPFSSEQRAWLNGFLAGWTGISDQPIPDGLLNGAAPQALPGAVEEPEDEDFPWHDSGMPMEERLELAKEKPLKRRLMAAMAQLDCGACGYLCQTYSEAIATGDEKSLTLCSPGGKETAKTLKRLLKEEGPADTNGHAANGQAPPPPPAAPSGFTRANPCTATVTNCYNLNLEGSAKQTSHVEISLTGSEMDYEVGDALGVYPKNCPDLVDEIIELLEVGNPKNAREQLITNFCLRSVNDELLELLAECADAHDVKQSLLGLIDSDELDSLDVLDVLRRAHPTRLTFEQLTDNLSPMAPRLYSIASSLKAHPNEVHLTVGRAAAQAKDRVYKGVASTMFSDRTSAGDAVRVYVHRSHGFTVPADPAAPMIMVGPGTGIAPFRAFLEERQATAAPGKNWLFFGDQRSGADFLYREQLLGMQESGLLTVLSTAFSRDQEQKIYVQDRMREQGAELFSWLEQGGYFYVCGDARRMAVDVDRALHEIVQTHGGMSEADASEYVAEMKAQNRYARDVY